MSEVQDDVRTFAEKAEDGMSDEVAYWKQRAEWAEGQPGAKRPFADQLAQEVIAGQVKEIDRLTALVKELRNAQSATPCILPVDDVLIAKARLALEWGDPEASVTVVIKAREIIGSADSPK